MGLVFFDDVPTRRVILDVKVVWILVAMWLILLLVLTLILLLMLLSYIYRDLGFEGVNNDLNSTKKSLLTHVRCGGMKCCIEQIMDRITLNSLTFYA